MRNNKAMKNVLKPSYTKRLVFFLVIDFLIFGFSLYLGLLFRFNFDLPKAYQERWLYWFLFFDILKISALWISQIYKLNWRFVSLNEFYKIVKALFFAFVFLYFMNSILQKLKFGYSLPRSSVIIDFFVSTFLVLFIRALRRVYLEIINPPKIDKTKKTVIIGAGDSGERIVRELKKGKNEYEPVIFVDDDKSKIGTLIHQVKVAGEIKDLERLIKKYDINSAIIAITTLTHKSVRELFDKLNICGIKDIKIVPTIDKLPTETVRVRDLKDLSIEDLLAREPVNIDFENIGKLFQNKTIIVTGAAGSIGSEIVRQLLNFKPKNIIGFEIDETELHSMTLSLDNGTFIPVVGDIRDFEKLKQVFEKFKPDMLFHAAAYKHVPLMEFFPEEAIKTNIFGTLNLAKLAHDYKVMKFINISTDKAVNPTSIMGATKRVAEMICRAYDKESETKFISVRFGNVLGSRGSAVPLFIEQIKNGGPVTITHPDMKRYFMSIPEAVLLVFQAAAMGDGGEVFVLDMGEPVKIVELVERLIKLEGLEPYRDIDIVFTGIRPGEKLFEELLTAEEGTRQTKHEKIYVANILNNFNTEDIEKCIMDFQNILASCNSALIRKKLKDTVPFFQEV